jgi:hypothetical protein
MEHEGILLALAQIAATFMGFTGIVYAFARMSGGDQGSLTGIARFRLVSMVMASLHSLMIAIIPFIFITADWPDIHVWQASSAIAVVFLLWASVFHMRSYLALRRDYGDQFVHWLIVGSSVVAYPALALLQVCNIMGWGFGPSFWPFLIAVQSMLLMTASIFILLIFRTGAPKDN